MPRFRCLPAVKIGRFKRPCHQHGRGNIDVGCKYGEDMIYRLEERANGVV